jgi:hypothetical protein
MFTDYVFIDILLALLTGDALEVHIQTCCIVGRGK